MTDNEHREQVVRRACRVMGWEYGSSPVWTVVRELLLAKAAAISLEKLEQMLDRIEGRGHTCSIWGPLPLGEPR